MITIAVICEYDPFHYGHKQQLDGIRRQFGKDCTILSLMSGDVVQRGRLALYPKYKRAEAAIRCGSDLVLELPAPYSCAGAEAFARGAVGILHGLGNIQYLCFGSESGNLSALNKTASVIRSETYLRALREAPEEESHMRNAERIYRSLAGDGFPIRPNDILGVEYLAAIAHWQSSITPITYRRQEGYSASEARRVLLDGENAAPFLPQEAIDVLTPLSPTRSERYDAIVLHTLQETNTTVLESYYGMNGGVAGLLKKCAERASSSENLIALGTSRKFSAARLRRAILAATLRYSADQVKMPPHFTCLLAANTKGCAYLSTIRKTSDIAIVTKPADGLTLPSPAKAQFEDNLRATRLMALVRGDTAEGTWQISPYLAKD